MIEVKLQTEPIDVNGYFQKLLNPHHGGNNLFIGTIRDLTGTVKTSSIEYYAYEEMAVKELEKLAKSVEEKYNADVVVVHRLGRLDISDIAVLVGVSTPHRNESYEGSRYIIEELKKRVPIWKKEFDEDKIRWGGIRDDGNR
ncbi:molybdenum cofactor biosynthesis protein MoaE [Bacillus thermotolerans]|uniref:molybdenum cofactor biosynthesis protein MoaE n=1 Tax=Bacillus thermotolerans TaxID=1221996 RepID=UPI00057D79C0|nr:molybdenum cofactor biosynthesis protein MoaE [Bacillus thermotolerans]KKB36903.1 Molybdenum cofactor biosynthesis protein MoaE [Bacillus thermotolerans]